ncbi:MAG: hypothetical protein GDA56_18340 [Hormoscilla sp. GM7CHS1pb]|nr:hypothetical protein [Hormoscilla sp. GM7CHS1pb]
MINNQPEPPSNPDRQKSGLQNSDSAQEELRILKEENSRLRKQIKELDTLEELLVYRVTDRSQKNVLALAIAIATILSGLFTAFGLLGIEKLFNSDEIKEEIVKAVNSSHEIKEYLLDSDEIREGIIDKAVQEIIKTRLQTDEIAKRVSSSAILAEQQQLKIEGEVEKQLVRAAERVRKKDRKLAEALQPSTSDSLYFVVAGASPIRGDLENELERVKSGNASLFAPGGRYAETKICRPKIGKSNPFYALVIAQNLTLPKTLDVISQAKQTGFRYDTYPLRSDKAFFDCQLSY